MTEGLKIILSLSLSGSLVIGAVWLLGRLARGRVSRRWQYYIWLIAVLRLLLPFGPESSPAEELTRQVERTAVYAVGLPEVPVAADTNPEYAEAAGLVQEPEEPSRLREIGAAALDRLWVVWLVGALAMLIRKATAYQSFVRYMRAGWAAIEDPAVLDLAAEAGAAVEVKRPVEVYVNPMAASPMLLGIFRPRVVLPSAELRSEDLRWVLRHELTHCRRWDGVYKWLVQLTVCVHWFNPLVHWMSREIARACELSCDEAVLRKLDEASRHGYGDALLRTMEIGGGYKAAAPSATLGESGTLLKERLDAIMHFRKLGKSAAALSLALAVMLGLTAAAAGAYTGVSVPEGEMGALYNRTAGTGNTDEARLKAYLEARQTAMYKAWGITKDQGMYYYQGERVNIFLDYQEDNGFYTMSMDPKGTLNIRIIRNEDGIITGVKELTQTEIDDLFGTKEDKDDDWDWDWDDEAWDEWEKDQAAAYKAHGVTRDGKNYYYQGKLVNIFLDLRPNKSFYTLDMNPAGTVNIKIIRNEDGEITGAAYLTEKEITELFEGGDEHVVKVDIDSVGNGEYVWLGTFELEEGDIVYYDVTAEQGERLSVGFARPGVNKPQTTYMTITNRRTDEELEVESGPMVWEDPLEPGEYSLFVHTKGGVLENVTGYVTIVKS